MKTLQEILEILVKDCKQRNLYGADPKLDKAFYKRATRTIHDTFMEIVREDEPGAWKGVFQTERDGRINGRNQLRSELRQAIKEWTGMK